MQNGNLEYGERRCGFNTKHQSTIRCGGLCYWSRNFILRPFEGVCPNSSAKIRSYPFRFDGRAMTVVESGRDLPPKFIRKTIVTFDHGQDHQQVMKPDKLDIKPGCLTNFTTDVMTAHPKSNWLPYVLCNKPRPSRSFRSFL